jgi:hypothetical protein
MHISLTWHGRRYDLYRTFSETIEVAKRLGLTPGYLRQL